MSARTDHDDSSALARKGGAADALARRRLLLGGARAAPVLMTLVSGPVSASLCTTGSIWGSMRPSGKQATTSCAGRSPDAWNAIKNKEWPSAAPASALFKDVFSPALNPGDVTLNKVVDPSKSFDTVARYVVAAYVNAAAALTPPEILNGAKAKEIWTSYKTKGFYEPTAGVRWDSAQIIAWIQTTFA